MKKGFYYNITYLNRPLKVITDSLVERENYGSDNNSWSICSVVYEGREVKNLVNLNKVEEVVAGVV